ncbi:MATE family efflux transporter [Shewanella youngdeokensis]|uniref:Multidrug-efflux transporter n=1 Tax=Shewanella youngdeokensis TaxID=2999068 RepID=A0ABZ0JTF4_9GAMM|nr:MATE family efflux transporter [Shewanella sp. DAU334]
MSLFSTTLKLIIERTLPLTVGLFAIMLVQLVDSVFIGMLGLEQLAVHGITLPFQAAVTGVQVGIGVAATSIMSYACGSQNTEKARATATISVVWGTVFISLICIILWLLEAEIFSAFVSSDVSAQHLHTLAQTFKLYWPFWLLSTVAVAALYLLTCVFRANGDTKTTGRMFLLASLINLILDPVLIFLLDMGIIGAAIASTIGYGCCAIYMFISAKRKYWLNTMATCFTARSIIVQLVRISGATVANQLLPSVSAFICILLIARISTESIAFWSLLVRLESFLLVFTLALTMSVPPMVGRYLGELRYSKINQLIMLTSKLLMLFHLFIALVMVLSATWLVPLLSNDLVIKNWFSIAMWVMPFSYAPLGLCMLVVSVLNAVGEPKQALKVSIVRLFILYVPAIWVGASTGVINNVVYSAFIANALAGAYAWLTLKRLMITPSSTTKYIKA